ncbi:MAG: glutamyl-tRNA reductase [Actinomycetota bacterium]|nr:glutamyl-tRNA reductase [Actinomycetota bacterium]
MSVLVVGISHRSAPVELLERVALDRAGAGKLAQDGVTSAGVAEAVTVATCNRVEVYAVVEKFHPGVSGLSELLARHAGVPLEALTPHLYVHYDDGAVQHAFAVAAGLDSMLVGESQILGQLKLALAAGQEIGTTGPVLNELLQQALRVGKRAHAETGIDRAGASLVSVGLELAEQALGPLPARRALVVGAGSMSALAATTLRRAGVAEVLVANRTLANATRLAAAVDGRAVPLDALADALGQADLVVSCTGAVGVVVPGELVARARAASGGTRPQFFLDLALPRDVDPAVRGFEGCTVVDLQRLAAVLETDPRGIERNADLDAVRDLVADEVRAFAGWQRATTVAPTVVALRAMAASVVEAELARLGGRLPELDARSRGEVALAVRRVVDKLLHAPTVRVKELATDPDGPAYASALRELFGLDPAAVAAVTAADTAADTAAVTAASLESDRTLDLGRAGPARAARAAGTP